MSPSELDSSESLSTSFFELLFIILKKTHSKSSLSADLTASFEIDSGAEILHFFEEKLQITQN